MLNLRYRAVCRPYSYTSRETTMPPSLRLVQILLPVVLLSVVVNLPRWDQRPIPIEKRKVRLALWLLIFGWTIEHYRSNQPTQVLWGCDRHWVAQCHDRWKCHRVTRICHLQHHWPQNGPEIHQVDKKYWQATYMIVLTEQWTLPHHGQRNNLFSCPVNPGSKFFEQLMTLYYI